MLPIKTLIEDIDALGHYLNGQVGWVPIEKVKKTIESKYVDNRKLESAKRLGLLDRDGTNIRLTDEGRAFVSGDEQRRAALMQSAIRDFPLYFETVEWMHHSKIENPSKAVIGNYWHDKHQDQLEGAQGAALTDAVIFFMRVAGEAGLGRFTRGTNARPDSYLKTDSAAIEAFVTAKPQSASIEGHNDAASSTSPSESTAGEVTSPSQASSSPSDPAPLQQAANAGLTTSPAVHVNVEIHIAANATAETVAEIFKNMRKYVLNNPDDTNATT